MRVLIANKDLHYGGRHYGQGEEFRCANTHCAVMLATGLARLAPTVEQPKQKPADEPRRTYRRRDMTPEE